MLSVIAGLFTADKVKKGAFNVILLVAVGLCFWIGLKFVYNSGLDQCKLENSLVDAQALSDQVVRVTTQEREVRGYVEKQTDDDLRDILDFWVRDED